MTTYTFLAYTFIALILGVGAGSIIATSSDDEVIKVVPNSSRTDLEVIELIARGNYHDPLENNPTDRSIYMIFRSWHTTNSEAALEAIANLPEEQSKHAIAGVPTSAAENDPAVLPSLIETLPVTNLMVQSSFDILAKEDLAKAIEIAQTLSTRHHQWAANSGLAPVIAKLSLEKAFEIVSSVENEDYRNSLVRETASHYARQGEIKVLDSQLGEALRPLFREQLGQTLIESTARTDPLLAARWINEGKVQTQKANILFEVYLMPELVNRPAALVMEVLENVENRGQALVSLLSSSSDVSEGRVMEFIEMEEDPEVRQALVGWYGSTNTDIAAFSLFVDRVAENEDDRTALLSEAAEQAMDQRRLDQAWLICSLGNDMEDSRIHVLQEYARQDPVAATALLAEIESTYKEAAIGVIASQWVMTDPRATADWLMTSTEIGDIPTTAYTSVADAWTRADSLNASDWVASLPAGAPKDAAIKGMIPHIITNDREAASTWVDEIADPKVKAELAELLENSMGDK